MTISFEKYSDILLDAYQTSSRGDEIAFKKKEILDDIFEYHDFLPNSILFVGFSPVLLKSTYNKVYVTQISNYVQDFLTKHKVDFTFVEFDSIEEKKFSAVVAVNEYFTFAETDEVQRSLVTQLVNMANNFIVTTLKDYKNQDFRERDFSYPVMIQNGDNKKIFFEQYEYDSVDRNACLGTNYIVDNEGVMLVGPFSRRAMFFKQLAKFSLDAGARSFLIHKNLMYKSIIKKNYEHIITINL